MTEEKRGAAGGFLVVCDACLKFQWRRGAGGHSEYMSPLVDLGFYFFFHPFGGQEGEEDWTRKTVQLFVPLSSPGPSWRKGASWARHIPTPSPFPCGRRPSKRTFPDPR